jgi:hypothetical protein
MKNSKVSGKNWLLAPGQKILYAYLRMYLKMKLQNIFFRRAYQKTYGDLRGNSSVE